MAINRRVASSASRRAGGNGPIASLLLPIAAVYMVMVAAAVAQSEDVQQPGEVVTTDPSECELNAASPTKGCQDYWQSLKPESVSFAAEGAVSYLLPLRYAL